MEKGSFKNQSQYTEPAAGLLNNQAVYGIHQLPQLITYPTMNPVSQLHKLNPYLMTIHSRCLGPASPRMEVAVLSRVVLEHEAGMHKTESLVAVFVPPATIPISTKVVHIWLVWMLLLASSTFHRIHERRNPAKKVFRAFRAATDVVWVPHARLWEAPDC